MMSAFVVFSSFLKVQRKEREIIKYNRYGQQLLHAFHMDLRQDSILLSSEKVCDFAFHRGKNIYGRFLFIFISFCSFTQLFVFLKLRDFITLFFFS